MASSANVYRNYGRVPLGKHRSAGYWHLYNTAATGRKFDRPAPIHPVSAVRYKDGDSRRKCSTTRAKLTRYDVVFSVGTIQSPWRSPFKCSDDC